MGVAVWPSNHNCKRLQNKERERETCKEREREKETVYTYLRTYVLSAIMDLVSVFARQRAK